MTSTRDVGVNNQIVALWKRLLSIRKRDWELSDYPVVIREHKFDAQFSSARFTQHRYVAYIVNWAVTGGGETPNDALQNLQINFQTKRDRRRLEGKPMIRPGGTGPLEFATQELISADPELNEDFIRRVLNLDWAWISDESSLWDFHTDNTNEKMWAKILEVYGVDVSDIESARLSEILNRIAATGWSADRIPGGCSPMHVAVNTPAGPMKAVRSYPSISGGLAHGAGGSAPALWFSRPAQRSLTLQPACSQSR